MFPRNGIISRLISISKSPVQSRSFATIRPQQQQSNHVSLLGIGCRRRDVRGMNQRSFSSLFYAHPTLQTREFPHFTPSYPNYFYPSRYWASTSRATAASKPAVFLTKDGGARDAKGAKEYTMDDLPSKAVSRWLFLCAGLTLGVIIVGAVTRLTESGLSITEWKPVTGVIPPLSDAAWKEEFDKYRKTPEFKLLNSKMTVDEFKSIFYMEWGHRILGRTIGLVFLVPYTYFLVKRRLPGPIAAKLGGLGLLLGFQGALGWYMVKSGLDQQIVETGSVPRVSQYRLAAHLGAAFLFFMGTLRLGLSTKKDLQWANIGLVNGMGDPFVTVLQDPRIKRFKFAGAALLALSFVTAISGAFVAGLDAGLIYNEFPFMGDGLMPPKNEMFSPKYSRRADETDMWWRNMLENPVTAQFDHRLLATTTYFGTALLYGVSRAPSLRTLLPPLTKHLVGASFAMVNIQAALGIATLLYLVPVHLAATHQAGSVLLLTTVLALLTSLRRPSSIATAVRLANKRAMTFLH
ncbi:Cytochrome c oxidase assembly protein cox15 [Serendipita sp. 397]|nr:Cytochrome c oxidase assembly protein cox15 [Serendipita sp. 397]